MLDLRKSNYIPNLKEYNESQTLPIGIMSGKEYRRKLRKDKRKKQ